MNSCPNCNILISSVSYSYCPYCRHVIRELELSCPEIVYAGTHFQVILSAKGIESVSVSALSLNDTRLNDGILMVTQDRSKEFSLKLEEPGSYKLEAKTPGKDICKTILCRRLGPFSLSWQNNQIIGLDKPESQRKVYVSRELSDCLVLPGSKTRSWLDISKIFVLSGDKEFKFSPAIDGFRISDDFFDYLQIDVSLKADIVIQTKDNHIVSIPELLFVYTQNIPDIKLKHIDYVNQNPIGTGNCEISYILSYSFQDAGGKRPVNQVRIQYHSSFIDEQAVTKYFDNNQQIKLDAVLNLSKIPSKVSDAASAIANRLEFSVFYSLIDCESEFCVACDIPFIIRDSEALPTGGLIAIDFGTSNTCIAYKGDASIELYADERGKFIPTFLKFNKFNEQAPHNIEFGWQAGSSDTPLTFATNFKPRLHKDEELFYFDRQHPVAVRALKPSSLTRLYLEALIEKVSWRLTSRPEHALISYPADFPLTTRLKIHEVLDNLGLSSDPSKTLTEPENIALYFALEPESPIKKRIDATGCATVCVFDCGGGTTDVCVVRVSKQNSVRFEILATWGTERFSGNYITYMIGVFLDGHQEWFPDDFSKLYTAKNEDLEQYFKQVGHYESVKCNSIGAYSEQKLYARLEARIREEIRDLFDLIHKNILQKLYLKEVIDNFYTDFFILAGNSCKLEVFHEEAKDCFYGSEIIYNPEKGKEAVALGAMKAHEMMSSLDIRGASLSKYDYFYRHCFDLKLLFGALIDMKEGAGALSLEVNPIPIPILGRKMIDDEDVNPVIMFTIPAPEEVRSGWKYKFQLRFVNKTFLYAWIAEFDNQCEEGELREIHYES